MTMSFHYPPGRDLLGIGTRPRPFYWQRETGWQLDEHGDKIPMTVSEMLDLWFSGFSSQPEEHEKWEKARRKRWVGEHGWTPREWVELLERMSYKPGWHVQLIMRPDIYQPTMGLEIETIQEIPGKGEQRLTSMYRIMSEFVRDEERAVSLVFRLIEEMEMKLLRECFCQDGKKYLTPRERAKQEAETKVEL